MGDRIKNAITKIEYIISASGSMHPLDTPLRKIEIMVGHAKDALVNLEQFQEKDNRG